jgi:hypothetical protein
MKSPMKVKIKRREAGFFLYIQTLFPYAASVRKKCLVYYIMGMGWSDGPIAFASPPVPGVIALR